MPKVNTRKMAITANIKDRRRQVAKLLLDGLTYQEIADKIGVKGKKTIHDDVHAIFAEWRKECMTDIEKSFLVELDRLKFVLTEAQEHWEKSKTAKRVRRTVRTLADGKKERTTETMRLVPDKNYLELIVRTSERLCKMLGLDAVQEIKLSGSVKRTEEYKIVLEARPASIDDRREVMRLLAPGSKEANGSEQKEEENNGDGEDLQSS